MTNFNRIRVVVMGSSRVGKSAVTVRYLTKRFIGEYSSSRDFLYKHTVVFEGGARTDVEILDTSKCSGQEHHPKFDGGGGMLWRRGRTAKTTTVGGSLSRCAGRRIAGGRINRGGSEEEDEEEDEEEEEEEGGTREGAEVMDTSPWMGAGGESCGADEEDDEEEEEHLRWGDAFVVVYSVCDRRSFRSARRLLARLSRLHGGRQGDEDGLMATPVAAPALLLGNKRDLDHAREIGVDAGQELSLRYGAQFYEVSAAQSYAGVSLAFHSLLREARSQRLLRTLSTSSSSSPSSSSCSISSSPPPFLFPLEHGLFPCHAPPPPPPPTPTPLHRLLRSLSSSSSSSTASSSSSNCPHGSFLGPSHHTLPHRCEAAFLLPYPSPPTPPPTPLAHSKTLPTHKRARLGMGNSVSKVLGTIFGKNGGSGDSSLCGGSDRKTKKKRPSLSI